MKYPFYWIIMILVLTSCSNHFSIQKRKYRSGFFIEHSSKSSNYTESKSDQLSSDNNKLAAQQSKKQINKTEKECIPGDMNNKSNDDLSCMSDVLTSTDSIESSDFDDESLTKNNIKGAVSEKKGTRQKLTRLVQNESNRDNPFEVPDQTLSQELSFRKNARSQGHFRNSNENLIAGLLTFFAVVIALALIGLFIVIKSALAPEIPPIINILFAIIVIAILIKVLRKIYHFDDAD
jgi:hypothetical protein